MFKKIIKQTFNDRLWNIISILVFVVGVLLLVKDVFETSLELSILIGGGFFVIVPLIKFSIHFTQYIIKYIHNIYVNSIWGNAIKIMNQLGADINDLNRKENISDEEFATLLSLFCNKLKEVFDAKTKASCSVSIKVPAMQALDLASMVVNNISRDSMHKNRDTDQYNSIKHTIIGNTAYRKIVSQICSNSIKPSYYLNNDVQNTRDYDSTSRECYSNGVLPYNSEIVFPIRPQKRVNDNKELCGFVCVDCEKKDAFDEGLYDIPIIETLADNLYDIIIKWKKNLTDE